MFNILCDELPKHVHIGDYSVPIYTDFREFIEITEKLLDPNSDDEVIQMCIDLIVHDEDRYFFLNNESFLREYFIEIKKFLVIENKDKQKKRSSKPTKRNRYTFSYTQDSKYILGAFRECYGINLLSIDYMHWWEFNAYLDALNEKCELMQRIYYRSIDVNKIEDKKERSRIMAIQRQIALDVPDLSDEDIANAFG